MPTFGSLFAGIGGIDLGLERAGWTGRWQVEIDPFCSRVLERHWPDVTRYGDIHAVDWSTVEPVDLVAGGFPCQPVSVAGKRLGQDDPRWLWPEFARAIRALRPRLVLVENVPGLMARGLGDALGDLAALGYDAEWDCIPAAAVGAPHRRDRLWIVAHADDGESPQPDGADGRAMVGAGARAGGRAGRRDPAARARRPDGVARRGEAAVADADRGRLEGPDVGAMALEDFRRSNADPTGSGWWAIEPDVGRVAHGVPARVDRLRSLGNAVVPQVVEYIGQRLLDRLAAEEALT